MSPRAKRSASNVPAWVTPAMQREHEQLAGTWWRCPSHGLTVDPVHLGDAAYCPDEGCIDTVVLVHRVTDDQSDREWNDMVAPAGRRARPAPITPDAPSREEPSMPARPPRTPDDRPATELVLEHLRAATVYPAPRAKLREVLRTLKPGASHSLLDAALSSLRKRGLVEVDDNGLVRLVESPAGARAAELRPEVPAPSAPPAVAAPTSAATVTVRLTPQMRARLDELVADGYCGFTAEEVAERFLARALRAFSAAN